MYFSNYIHSLQKRFKISYFLYSYESLHLCLRINTELFCEQTRMKVRIRVLLTAFVENRRLQTTEKKVISK